MSGERPSHRCFVVEERGEGERREAFWTRIGSAWPHKDGKGLSLQLSALPANGGRIVLRELTEEDRRRAPAGGRGGDLVGARPAPRPGCAALLEGKF